MKVTTYGQCKYVIAGAKQTSSGVVKNNFFSFPLPSQNVTAALIFHSLTKKRNQRKLGRFEHK